MKNDDWPAVGTLWVAPHYPGLHLIPPVLGIHPCQSASSTYMDTSISTHFLLTKVPDRFNTLLSHHYSNMLTRDRPNAISRAEPCYHSSFGLLPPGLGLVTGHNLSAPGSSEYEIPPITQGQARVKIDGDLSDTGAARKFRDGVLRMPSYGIGIPERGGNPMHFTPQNWEINFQILFSLV